MSFQEELLQTETFACEGCCQTHSSKKETKRKDFWFLNAWFQGQSTLGWAQKSWRLRKNLCTLGNSLLLRYLHSSLSFSLAFCLLFLELEVFRWVRKCLFSASLLRVLLSLKLNLLCFHLQSFFLHMLFLSFNHQLQFAHVFFRFSPRWTFAFSLQL